MDNESTVQRVVASAQQGDQSSLAELFRLFSDRVYGFFRARISDEAEAEDLTQIVFLEMLRSLHRYAPKRNAKFSTWLFQIARHRLIDFYRARRTTIPLDSVEPAHPSLTSDPVEPDLDKAVIDRAFRHLPEHYQTVLHLRFREDMSVADVARIMERTKVGVRVIQYRALRSLRRLLIDLNT